MRFSLRAVMTAITGREMGDGAGYRRLMAWLIPSRRELEERADAVARTLPGLSTGRTSPGTAAWIAEREARHGTEVDVPKR